MPVPLMSLLAIPLSNQKTVTKWLVITSTLSRKRAREQTFHYANLTNGHVSQSGTASVNQIDDGTRDQYRTKH
jgi:hypothetical protein